MDLDGVYGGLVYPSTGLPLYGMENNDLLRAVFAAYNDWLAEFCSADPERLKGIAEVLLDEGVEEGIAELRRCAEMGLIGAMISSYPKAGQTYNHPMYEPFWAAAEELNLPISLHVTTNRPGARAGGRRRQDRPDGRRPLQPRLLRPPNVWDTSSSPGCLSATPT